MSREQVVCPQTPYLYTLVVIPTESTSAELKADIVSAAQ